MDALTAPKQANHARVATSQRAVSPRVSSETGHPEGTGEDTSGLIAHQVHPTSDASQRNGRSPPVARDRVRAALLSLAAFDAAFVERLRVRFFAKVSPPDANGCHLWTGALNSAGYGSIGVGSRGHSTAIVRAAHRIGYLLAHGSCPAGMVLDHLCRVTACVNPAHLEPVTVRENVVRGYASRRVAVAP